MTRWVLAVLIAGAVACAPAIPAEPAGTPGAAVTGPAAYRKPQAVGRYDIDAVPEASGLAASRRNPGVWWLMSDGHNKSVWAIRETGETIGHIELGDFRTGDTEALAVAPCAAGSHESCVYVGDIGDNNVKRRKIRIARFVEPDLTNGVPPIAPSPKIVGLEYPGDGFNAEALLVDEDGLPYVVTKQPGPPQLFMATEFASGTLVPLGTVPMPHAFRDLLGTLVTDGSTRQGHVILRTYGQAVEFVAPTPDAPLRDFPSWPSRSVPSPLELQSEAIAYTLDGTGYLTLGEGDPTIWMVTSAPA